MPTQAHAAKISRTPSVAAPKSMKPVKSSIARASSVRTAPGKDGRVGSTETVDYLALKRRPISMSFPTPAPPPKGRAPTKPTFQLSSNDTVARLKAQKEEKLKYLNNKHQSSVLSASAWLLTPSRRKHQQRPLSSSPAQPLQKS